MPTLRIEHAVSDFAKWRLAFDRDPADRKASGVTSYRILRAIDDPNYVMIDLEFPTLGLAQAFLAKMEAIWSGPGKSVMTGPKARILELVEANEPFDQNGYSGGDLIS